MKKIFSAPQGIGGELIPPADKSISHRLLLLAAVARGRSQVENILDTGDCRSTLGCLRTLGITIEEQEGRLGRAITIQGVGLKGFREPEEPLQAGNSGTTLRLMAGLLAGQPIYAVFTGDRSLRSRPMLRIVEPLRRMGALIYGRDGGRYAPLSFLPGSPNGTLSPIQYELPLASAQVKSALLLAALRAAGKSVLSGRLDSRDHTERLFEFLQLPLGREGGRLTIEPVGEIPPFELEVPGDLSSAAFFIAAALISRSALVVRRCGLNPTRLGFIEVLRRMGAGIEIEQENCSVSSSRRRSRLPASCGNEPIGSLKILPGRLKGVSVSGADIPLLIDEIPLIAVLGAQAEGVTEVRGAGELRHKESDRIEAIFRMITALGGEIEIREDGFILEGPQRLSGGTVDAAGDHRVAMAAAVLSAGIRGRVEVRGFEAATVSYPDFQRDFCRLGGRAE